jgi:DNA-binding NarL/FixJ family response regulator
MDHSTLNCVLLADRHHGLSEGVRGLLETTFAGVFMVADEASLMEGAARLRPSVVVVDVSLAGGDIVSLLRGIQDRAPAAKVLLLSVHDEPTVAAAALAAGADGLVLKRAISTDLLAAVKDVLAGKRYVSPGVTAPSSRPRAADSK